MGTGMKGFMLGLSGGIDSFVSAALVADAVRDISGLVHLLILPNGDQKDIHDALECAKALTDRFSNITCETVNIAPMYGGLLESIEQSVIRDHADDYFLPIPSPGCAWSASMLSGKGFWSWVRIMRRKMSPAISPNMGTAAATIIPWKGSLSRISTPSRRSMARRSASCKKAPAAGLGISNTDEEELGFTYEQLSHYLHGNLVEKRRHGAHCLAL